MMFSCCARAACALSTDVPHNPLHHINFPVGCQLLRSERAEFVDEGRQERPAALNVGTHSRELRGHGDGKHPGNVSAGSED